MSEHDCPFQQLRKYRASRNEICGPIARLAGIVITAHGFRDARVLCVEMDKLVRGCAVYADLFDYIAVTGSDYSELRRYAAEYIERYSHAIV